jgi:hypothetical protein
VGNGWLPPSMNRMAATKTDETRTSVVPSTSQVTLLAFTVSP